MNYLDSDWTSEAEAEAAAQTRQAPRPWVPALLAGVAIGVGAASIVFFLIGRATHDAPVTAAAHVAPAAAASAATVVPVPSGATIATTEPLAASAAASAVTTATPLVDAAPAAGPPPPTAEEVQRKLRAWARVYRRPAACEGNPSSEQLVECANHYIRARREFEERWKAGQL